MRALTLEEINAVSGAGRIIEMNYNGPGRVVGYTDLPYDIYVTGTAT